MAVSGPQGQQFDYAQLEGLWIGAGGPHRLAPMMAAIAMAESGGRSDARNPSGATGLWQILGNPFPGNAADPETNARMAVAKWRSQGLGAWVTYTSGAYRRFLKRGVAPQDPGGTGGKSASIGYYVNPLRRVQGLSPERIDMGVDYQGRGPITALGEGVITGAGHAWSGAVGAVGPGTWITERLTKGPLKGRQVYWAENIDPINVRVGQQVTGQTVIGQMTGQGAGIETGFAAPGAEGAAGTPMAYVLHQEGPASDPGAVPTAIGQAFSDLMFDVGGKRGTGAVKGGTGSAAAGWPPPWLVGIISGTDKGLTGSNAGGSGVAGALGGIGSSLASMAQAFADLDTAVQWLLQPSNWVRILCGVFGSALVIGGLAAFMKVPGAALSEAGGGPVGAVPALNTMALPTGMAMIGLGGVLLFVAFHNLSGSPASLAELLGSLRDSAQAGAAGQKSGPS